MSVTQSSTSVYGMLLLLLSQKPDRTAKELRELLLAQGQVICSLQAIYKELNRLEAEGKVLRHRSRYRLHLAYVHESLALADAMNDIYCRTPQHSLREILRGNQKFTFHNLIRLNDFWTNLSLSLVLEAKRLQYYSWNPYSWFFLFQSTQEQKFYQVLRSKNFEVFKILGDDSWVNLEASKAFDGAAVHLGFGRSPFSNWVNTYFTIVDETLITVELSQKTANRLYSFLTAIQSSRQIHPLLLVEWTRTPILATLSITDSTAKARKYKKWFQEYF